MLKRYLITGWLSVSVLFGSGIPMHAQSTPEELARQLVEAINEGNRALIEALLHPSTKEFYKNKSPDIFKKQIDNFLKNKFPESYELQLTRIDEVEQYDLSADAYTFLGMQLEFSKRPDLKMDIDRTEVIKNSQGREITLKSKGISEMIIKENNRWYIIRPNVIPDRIKVRQKN